MGILTDGSASDHGSIDEEDKAERGRKPEVSVGVDHLPLLLLALGCHLCSKGADQMMGRSQSEFEFFCRWCVGEVFGTGEGGSAR